MQLINFIANQIFAEPAVLFGLIVLLGLLLQKKTASEVMVGTVKTIIGYYVLIGGVTLLQNAIMPLSTWMQAIFGVQGIQPQEFVVMGVVMETHAGQVGAAIMIGFALNILLARFTRHKYIAITGHLMLHWAAWIVGMVAATDLSPVMVVLVSGAICGVQYWLSPTIIHYFMRKTDRMTDEWSLYCHEVVGITIASTLGKIVGNKDKRCDDLNVPESFEWLRDTTVGMAVIASIIWVIIGLIAGPTVISEQAGSQNWIIYLILLGIQFSGGLSVLLYGVRMLIGELVPAFVGISEKLVPGAIPGLDYPTVFHFAPNAVFIGFIFNLLGAIVATALMVVFKSPIVILPAVWINFWQGALVGIFADVYGGRRGTIIITFLTGLLSALGWAFIYPLQGIAADCGAVYNYTDSASYGAILAYIISLF
ncbi:MAG: ascorbate system component [Eubacteriaceae bacterium]|jgi:PTS system ascorbate-specific IIC component|nr:ascorbate system component [Eubacteriaceae bacterium]MDK2904591.1 ascorbate system component [Eubacteriaceae bacterium]MDK2937112.1 ascorbate system component [Eubacteriaceae bacterium]MDK2961331.1 ascorbate system component [Eubacteriaceae bacterium]MDN5307481.1 ascorbate system component [Eubacteriaceae bacterium]